MLGAHLPQTSPSPNAHPGLTLTLLTRWCSAAHVNVQQRKSFFIRNKSHISQRRSGRLCGKPPFLFLHPGLIIFPSIFFHQREEGVRGKKKATNTKNPGCHSALLSPHSQCEESGLITPTKGQPTPAPLPKRLRRLLPCFSLASAQ